MSSGGNQGQQLSLRYASQQARPHIDDYYHSSHATCMSPPLYAVPGYSAATAHAVRRREELHESLAGTRQDGSLRGSTTAPAVSEPLHSTWSSFSDSEQLFVAPDRRTAHGAMEVGLVHSCSWRHRRPELSCREHNHRHRYVGERQQNAKTDV